MIVSKERYSHGAFVLTQKDVLRLEYFFQHFVERPSFEIECRDGSRQLFANSSKLLSFANSRSTMIRSLWIRAANDERMSRARVRFSNLHAPVYLELSGERAVVARLQDAIARQLEAMRPSFLPMFRRPLRFRLRGNSWGRVESLPAGTEIDFYKVLKLPAGVSLEEVEGQYRFLLRAWHPDSFTGADREEQLAQAEIATRQLNEAYDALQEAAARQQFDWDSPAAEEPLHEASGSPAYGLSNSREETALEPDEHPLFRMAPQGRVREPAQAAPSSRRNYAAGGGRRSALVGVLLLGGIVTAAYVYLGPGSSPSVEQGAEPERPTRQGTHMAGSALQPAVFVRQQPPTARLVRRNEAVEEPVHASRTKQPMSADVILPKDAQRFGAEEVGNIEVIYADGTQDTWTARGNCGQPHVASDGTVGWTVFQTPNAATKDADFQPNGTLVLCRRGHLLARVNSTLDYIEDWAFLDSGKAVVLRTRGPAGGAIIERHDCATGRLLDKLNEAGTNLPAWALSLRDR